MYIEWFFFQNKSFVKSSYFADDFFKHLLFDFFL